MREASRPTNVRWRVFSLIAAASFVAYVLRGSISIATADGYSVIGGGDTVTAATKYVDLRDISYVCTAGGAMVRFLSGKKLPLMVAMDNAYARGKQTN